MKTDQERMVCKKTQKKEKRIKTRLSKRNRNQTGAINTVTMNE